MSRPYNAAHYLNGATRQSALVRFLSNLSNLRPKMNCQIDANFVILTLGIGALHQSTQSSPEEK